MAPVFYEDNPHKDAESFFSGPICDHPFPMHVHDAVEMVCLSKGHMVLTIGGEKVRLGPGDIGIAFPAVPHSYDEVSEDVDGMDNCLTERSFVHAILISSPNAVT